MTLRTRIALASPHSRHDELERELREAPDLEVLRVRTQNELARERIKALGLAISSLRIGLGGFPPSFMRITNASSFI